MSKNDYLEKSRAYKGYHYSVLDSSALDYLHQRTLEMFKQVKCIFEANSIRYMICGGTLLGAIGGGMGTSFNGMMTTMFVFSKKTMKGQ